MRKIIFMLVMLFSSLMCNAQQKVIQIGNNFKVEKTEKKSESDVKTPYTITVNGKTYPIYKGKKGGLYYIGPDGKKKICPQGSEREDTWKKAIEIIALIFIIFYLLFGWGYIGMSLLFYNDNLFVGFIIFIIAFFASPIFPLYLGIDIKEKLNEK